MKKLFLLILILIPIQIKAISASSYVVMDMDNLLVLEGSNINQKRLIASITKIMTCIIAIENGDLDEIIEIDKDVLKMVGSSIYIEIGEKISLKDLLYGMMLRSGNDAALMVAKTISGSMEDFATLMNKYAEKIGMKNTYFYNSHGLEEKDGSNTSTAYDMALLTSYAMKNKTFRKIFSTKKYVAESDKKTYSWLNKNKLLKYSYITGGKTGYTVKAHRTLVTTGLINNINVVIVTLNAPDDWLDHLSLYKMVNKEYKKVVIAKKDSFKNYDNNELYIKKDVNVTIKKEDKDNIKIKYYIDSNSNNMNIKGSINVYLDEKLLVSEPIYIKTKTNKKGLKNFLRKIFA